MAETVFNPTATEEDGLALRDSVTESFATIISANGTGANDSDNDVQAPYFTRTGSDYTACRRAVFQFDTSSIGTDDISAATLELYHESQSTNMGDLTLVVVGCTPDAAGTVIAADYQTRATTALSGTVALSALTTSQYNTFTLNADGRAAINKSGVTALMLVFDADRSGTDPAVGTSAWAQWESQEDAAGNDPILRVTHAEATTTSTTTTTSTSTTSSTSTTTSTTISTSTTTTSTSTTISTSTSTTQSTSTTTSTTISTTTTSTSTTTTVTTTTTLATTYKPVFNIGETDSKFSVTEEKIHIDVEQEEPIVGVPSA